eukprot:TRINITY_DN5075_c2_g1_i3.p4 TRINITY_DN5075_c2_g1~~TRINITY_DN5075_c2_g1_i3.p4  ORF type:complete len:121 (+),score=10.52 TRINITY_DN5075_c2_g1_i3:821-1183(+)
MLKVNLNEVDDELSSLRERFEMGELKAFGPHQTNILGQFQQIRLAQAELSMKQIDSNTRTAKHGFGQGAKDRSRKKDSFEETTDISRAIKDKEQAFAELEEMMDGICGQIAKVNQLVKNI